MFSTLLTGMVGGMLGCAFACNFIQPYLPAGAQASPSPIEMEGCVNRSTRSNKGPISVLDCN